MLECCSSTSAQHSTQQSHNSSLINETCWASTIPSVIVYFLTGIPQSWFLEHDNEFTLLKWPTKSPDLNPIEHLWDVVEREIRIMDVQPTNLQQLCDAIMSLWTKISEECFQHLVESIPRRIKAVLEAKGGPTRY